MILWYKSTVNHKSSFVHFKVRNDVQNIFAAPIFKMHDNPKESTTFGGTHTKRIAVRLLIWLHWLTTQPPLKKLQKTDFVQMHGQMLPLAG